MKESDLVRRIKKAVAAPDVYLVKFHGNAFTRVGVPDLIGNVGPFAVYLEVKVPGAYPTPRQRAEMMKISKTGGKVTVVRTVAEAVEVVSGLRSRAAKLDTVEEEEATPTVRRRTSAGS